MFLFVVYGRLPDGFVYVRLAILFRVTSSASEPSSNLVIQFHRVEAAAGPFRRTANEKVTGVRF